MGRAARCDHRRQRTEAKARGIGRVSRQTICEMAAARCLHLRRRTSTHVYRQAAEERSARSLSGLSERTLLDDSLALGSSIRHLRVLRASGLLQETGNWYRGHRAAEYT